MGKLEFVASHCIVVYDKSELGADRVIVAISTAADKRDHAALPSWGFQTWHMLHVQECFIDI